MANAVANVSERDGGHDLVFMTAPNLGVAPVEIMRIKGSTANVGIGTNAPSTQLHTTGGVRFAGVDGAFSVAGAGGYNGGGDGGTHFSSSNSGGGGGSSWVTPSGSSLISHTADVRTGNGQITISW